MTEYPNPHTWDASRVISVEYDLALRAEYERQMGLLADKMTKKDRLDALFERILDR